MSHEPTEEFQRAEKAKARELRKSRWWQNRISSSPCYYCGVKLVAKEATMDHIVPICQGGTSTKGNVVPACKACNTAKKDRSAAEWALEKAASPLAVAAELHHVGDDRQQQ